MKKYMFTFIIALIIGFFLSNFFLKQYDDYNGIKVSNEGYKLYFIEYGIYNSKEELEQNTINLQNYIYNEDNNLYYVYVGITKKKKNAEKIVDYYKTLGYETNIKEYFITNKSFVEVLDNLDKVLEGTNDNVVIASIINQTLSKYEEVVLHG